MESAPRKDGPAPSSGGRFLPTVNLLLALAGIGGVALVFSAERRTERELLALRAAVAAAENAVHAASEDVGALARRTAADRERLLRAVEAASSRQAEIGEVDLSPWERPLTIGQYTDPAPPFQVHGLIDDARIYQRALSAEEIQAAFRSLSAPAAP